MKLLGRASWIVTAIYWCVLFIATHMPPAHMPKTGVNDKFEHLTAYGLLATLLYISFWLTRPQLRTTALVVIAIALAYGAIDEWTQALPFVHRSCELADWLADATGATTITLAMAILRKIIASRAGGRVQSSDTQGVLP